MFYVLVYFIFKFSRFLLSAIFNEAQVSETAYCSIDISSELFTSLFVN